MYRVNGVQEDPPAHDKGDALGDPDAGPVNSSSALEPCKFAKDPYVYTAKDPYVYTPIILRSAIQNAGLFVCLPKKPFF